jgi:HK97 family phage prohead protease
MRVVIWDEKNVSNGYIVKTDGIDLTRFLANPVLLLNHDESKPPIGRVENINKEDGKLIGELIFDLDDPDAVKIKKKFEGKFMKGLSPRFLAPKADLSNNAEGVPIYAKSEMVELSAVTIPANKGSIAFSGDVPEGSEILTFNIDFQKINKTEEPKMKQLYMALGIAAEAKEDEAVRKVDDLKNQISAKDGEIADLKNKIEDINKKFRQKEIDDLVDGAVGDKKIIAGEAEQYKKFALMDFDGTKAMLDAKNGYQSVTTQVQSGSTATNVADLKNKMETRKDWKLIDWMKKDPKGLNEMKNSLPAAFNALED